VKLLHLILWFASALSSLQVFPISLISSSIILFQVFLGRPLLLAPWGFQSNASFSMAPAVSLKCDDPSPFSLFNLENYNMQSDNPHTWSYTITYYTHTYIYI
jgi:hypothetical protein